MRKFLVQFVALLIVIFVAALFFKGKIITIPFVPQPTNVRQVVISDAKIKVEIADTQAKRSQGLGGRESIASDEGMLFIFEKVDKYSFWMKGLKFSLDFVWIRGDQIVDLLTNISPPQPGQKDETLPIYQSKEPIDKVLEVNAGTADRLKIKVGDTIKLE